jgi:hypothetical protein
VYEFINQFDFPVNKFLKDKLNQKIGAGEHQQQGSQTIFPVGTEEKDANGNRT